MNSDPSLSHAPSSSHSSSGEHASETGEGRLSSFFDWMATVDHKRIGILYLWTTFFFFCIGGLEAALMRLQLSVPNNHFLSPEAYNQIFTMHGTTMIFLVVMPALIGFINYFVPLMIGARDMAFPRLNAMSYWLLLFGGILLHFSLLAGGAPNAGWFSYPPLSEKQYSSHPGIDYWILSLLVLGIGSVASSINAIATILTLRAPGLSIRRLPLFVWMSLVNSILIVLAIPILNATIVMLLIDRQLDAFFFDASNGGSAILWQHLFWSFGHPEVYIMALPAFGMISEVIPVFSRKPIFGYEFIAASTVAIAVLSFGVWAHHMFTTGMGYASNLIFAGASLLIAIPTGVKIFNWIATMWGGSLHFTTSMMFAIAFLVEFVIGGLSGVMFAVVPIDWQTTDTYFVVAHFHYVLFGGTFFAILAGLYYWFPKMTGRFLSERLGRAHFWLNFAGFNLTFFVQHFLGLMGMPRRVFTYPDLPYWGSLNMLSTFGVFLTGLSVLVFFGNIVKSLRCGARADDNPWNAWSLEWATTSPPPHQNFDRVPPVLSRRPLWDLAHPEKPDQDIVASEKEAGFDKNKVSMYSFVVSEAAFFIALILTYLWHNFHANPNSKGASLLDPLTAGIFTACLVASSFTMWRAEAGFREGSSSRWRIWLAATILLGVIFISGQGMEYRKLLSEGVRINSDLFATSFFTLTGFHGLHVCFGLIALLILLGLSMTRDFRTTSAPALETIGIYWHFVDIVWIAVFSIIYLRTLL